MKNIMSFRKKLMQLFKLLLSVISEKAEALIFLILVDSLKLHLKKLLTFMQNSN